MVALMGGNVRVGLEDSLYIGKGKLATSNAEQVTKMRRVLEALDLEIATPDEARQILALKGAASVGFSRQRNTAAGDLLRQMNNGDAGESGRAPSRERVCQYV